MIAYNKEWLDNSESVDELENAYFKNLISKEEKEAAKKIFPVGFYSPNIFIRIGLFLLTVVIVGFSIGLVSLLFLFGSNDDTIFATLLIFFGLLTYGLLELMVQQKQHYKSGVDDALLWLSGSCIVGGLNLVTTISTTTNAIVIFIISLYFLLRFANALMGLLVALSLFSIVFLTYSEWGNFAKATTPFLLLLLASGIYFFTKKLSAQIGYRHHKNALMLMQVTALIAAYFSVNYFVVREASISLFYLDLKDGEGIAFGWLFWFFTFFIPVAYIFRGVQKKDVVLLRVGLLLLAAIVFTIRFYHSILPAEVVMTVGGLLLTGIACGLIQYLKEPKYGFTYLAGSDKYLLDKMNIEALVIAETFTATAPAENTTGFGGGSFGGGGASGDF